MVTAKFWKRAVATRPMEAPMLVQVELLIEIEVPTTVAVSARDEEAGEDKVQVVQSKALGLIPNAFPAAVI